jgi:AhpD family alkylhydroperoxidase
MLDVPQPRLANPAFAVAGVFDALQALGVAVASVGLEPRLLELVKMRASQINRCAVCLEGHGRLLRRAGETDARLDSLAGWRDSPHFAPAERAALALTEAATRLADRDDPARRPRRPGARRGLGRRRRDVPAAAPRRAGRDHRRHQPVQSPERRDPAAGGQLAAVTAPVAAPRPRRAATLFPVVPRAICIASARGAA